MKNNPYVGPRPYEREDRHNFHGRGREARELRALIVAEREVLFYAQSGAGKTSLLNAAVIPALEEKGFHVLPTARVGSELPPGIESTVVDNVFVFSVLLTLAGAGTPPESLLHHTLRSFLEKFYPEPEDEFASRPLALICDQFEEIFTTHQERWQDAEGFFRQVREALDAIPRLGVVFAMREDYVAGVDSYATLFPRRLRARFRMEQLGPQGALAAVTQPAANAGCAFAPGVAERLVDDLRRVQVHQYRQSGKTAPRRADDAAPGEQPALGPYVEPVQLQVVCRRLWENLPEQADYIVQWEEVEQYGNIDRALTDFYETSLAQAVRETARLRSSKSRVSERRLRRWFGEHMITPVQTRGLALQGPDNTAGLPNAAVAVLEQQHLIRADVRAGARWYELTHDRLIAPIRDSNKAWSERKQHTLLVYLLIAIVALCVSSGIAWKIWQDRVFGATQAAAAAARSEVWLSVARTRVRPLRPGLSVGGEQVTVGTLGAFAHDATGGFYLISASDVLGRPEEGRDAPVLQPGRTDGGQMPDDVIGYALPHSPVSDGSPVALLTSAAQLKEDIVFETTIPGIGPIRGVCPPQPEMVVWLMGRTSGLVTGKIQQVGVPMKIYAEQGAVQFVDAIVTSQASAGGDGGALVVSEDGCAVGMLVAGGKSASIVAPIQDVLERLQLELVFAGQNLTTLADPRIRPVDAVWLPDGQRIVVGAEDGAAYAWNVRTGQVEMTLDARTSPVSAVAVSPDGRWAAIGDADGAVRLWDLTTSSLLDLGTSTGMVNAVTFSPDGRWLAAGGEDAAVRVWDISAAPDPAKAPAALRDLQSAVTSIAISPDGYHLAAGGQDGVVLVWNLSTLESDASLTLRLENRIVDVFFNPDGGQLIATNVDAQAELRDMTTGREETFDWPVSPLSGVAWSPDGEQIVLVGSDGQALAVDLKDSTDLFTFSAHAGRITRAAWNPSGVQVLTIGADGALRVWQAK